MLQTKHISGYLVRHVVHLRGNTTADLDRVAIDYTRGKVSKSTTEYT